NVDASAMELRARAAQSAGNAFYQIGIAASGFGSFEQMLIGRTFLYDRLYHHHKVRAAEAMAQRLMLVAERDRGKRVQLSPDHASRSVFFYVWHIPHASSLRPTGSV